MADPALGQVVASVWENVIGKKPSDNIFTSRALFYFLGEKGFKEEADGGRLIEFSLEYAENTTFKSYSETEELDTTRIDVYDAARFEWKINAGTVVYSELEKLRAAAAARKFDVIEGKLENGKNSHVAAMNRQAFSDGTGNGSKDIAGLQHLISTTPTTGTVGGISRATWSFWRNKQTSGAQTAGDFDNLRASMRSVFNQCSNGGTEFAPTAWITTRTVFEGYESLLVANERYAKDGSSQRGGDAGFDNNALLFKGAKGFYDEDAPSGNLYFLNPKFIKFAYLKGGWMKMYPAVDPANQLSNVHKVATFGNMGTNCSRRLGVVSSIT
mgnify:CR=1 FL=1